MYQSTTIVGNVGRDAVLKYTSSGVAVADFSVAVSKVTGSGETRTEKTTWFRVTLWRNLAESVAPIIKKGAKILVTGEVSASSYVDKAGVTQVNLELNADGVKLLSSRAEMEGRSGNAGEGYDDAPAQEGTPAPRSNRPSAPLTDDIPF